MCYNFFFFFLAMHEWRAIFGLVSCSRNSSICFNYWFWSLTFLAANKQILHINIILCRSSLKMCKFRQTISRNGRLAFESLPCHFLFNVNFLFKAVWVSDEAVVSEAGPGSGLWIQGSLQTTTVNEVALGWKLVRRGGTAVVAAAGGLRDVTALVDRRDFSPTCFQTSLSHFWQCPIQRRLSLQSPSHVLGGKLEDWTI